LRRQYPRRCNVSRPGSGWDWVGPLRSGHGSLYFCCLVPGLPPAYGLSTVLHPQSLFSPAALLLPPAPPSRAPHAEAQCQATQPLDHEHAFAAPVTERPRRASLPGHLPGVLPACAVRELILGRASRLDAFSGYRFPTWLPSSAPVDNWHTSGRSNPVLSY
jgi:hypothetical protein